MTWSSWLTRSGWLALALCAAVGQAAAAQHRAGSFEAGAFVQVNRFDNSFQLDNATGAGARFGVFLRPKLSLELTAAWAQAGDTTGRSISYVPISLFALFHLPILSNLDVLLGPGYVHTEYGTDASASADGFSALVGLRATLTDRLGLRADTRADFYSSSPLGNERSVNFALTAGLSFFFGKRAPQDLDGDGVAETLDRCPGTPPGTAVDATGCPLPSDADLDGVLDPLDLCPDTPRGVRIDQNGCPLDRDDNGVNDRDAGNDSAEGRALNRRATLRRLD